MVGTKLRWPISFADPELLHAVVTSSPYDTPLAHPVAKGDSHSSLIGANYWMNLRTGAFVERINVQKACSSSYVFYLFSIGPEWDRHFRTPQHKQSIQISSANKHRLSCSDDPLLTCPGDSLSDLATARTEQRLLSHAHDNNLS